MYRRPRLVKVVIVFLTIVLVLLVFMSRLQSDRLYKRFEQVLGGMTGFGRKGYSQNTKGSADEGDWLIWRMGSEPATLNYVTGKDIYTPWITYGNIFESLLERDLDSGLLKPKLAESYDISKDGLQIAFTLREDTYFSDGEKVTADDIVFTYRTIMNPMVDGLRLRSQFEPIKEIQKVDDRTVKFVMQRPYFKAVEIAGLMAVLPEHVYGFSEPHEFNKYVSSPIGSGPFIFERWDVGREIALRCNENYWGLKPRIKKIIYRIIMNESAALHSLQRGEIDMMTPTPEQFVYWSNDDIFRQNFYCLSYWNPGAGYTFIVWNQNKEIFNDRRVRHAMTHLIDRQAIVKHLLNGLGREVTGPFYCKGAQYNKKIGPWPFDPDKAQQQLSEAGWADSDDDGIRDKTGSPFKFKFMIVSSNAVHERIAKMLKEQAAKAGIEVIIDPYEWSVFEERLYEQDFDAAVLAWFLDAEQDPYNVWHSSQRADGGANFAGFANARADMIIEEARRIMDSEMRNSLYHELHEIIHFEQPYTFLWSRPSLRFVDKRFKNVKVHLLGLKPAEWYVPAEKQKYK